MANVKTTMTDIRVIIREFSRGTSLREMERELNSVAHLLEPIVIVQNLLD